MSDDPSKTGQNRKLINLEQDHELRDWMQSLGCGEAELRLAVEKVGNSADAVRDYLAKR